jgi:hypothetical protein
VAKGEGDLLGQGAVCGGIYIYILEHHGPKTCRMAQPGICPENFVEGFLMMTNLFSFDSLAYVIRDLELVAVIDVC